MSDQKMGYLSAPGGAQSLSALARENRQLSARVAELERLVICDTLTPLFNRRHFMAELDRWCWRTHRYGGEYGLLFIDVDNLKAVNDGHGHLAGDALLTGLAKGLLGAVRCSDLVARVGGDEFAILLDNIPIGELAGKAAQIAQAVGGLKIEHRGKTLRPSVSAGYAAMARGMQPAELLLRADRSMYVAKRAKASARLPEAYGFNVRTDNSVHRSIPHPVHRQLADR